MTKLSGRCLCRDITFEITGELLQIVHCHCDSCRRTCSAPVASFLIIRRSDLHYTNHKPNVYESSPGVQRSFCPRCGSPIAYATAKRPEQIDLYVCSLDNPAIVVPRAHVHAIEQLPWFEIADDLPRYAGSLKDGRLLRHGPASQRDSGPGR